MGNGEKPFSEDFVRQDTFHLRIVYGEMLSKDGGGYRAQYNVTLDEL